jgi:hypothetical protein
VTTWEEHDELVPELDDAAIEALLTGEEEAGHVGELLAALRAEGQKQPPSPSPALAAILIDGLPAAGPAQQDSVAGAASADSPRRLPSRRRALRTAVLAAVTSKLGLAMLGATAALASVGLGGAAGVLPAPVNDTVRSIITTVTGIELDDSDDAGGSTDPSIDRLPEIAPPAATDEHRPGDGAGQPAEGPRPHPGAIAPVPAPSPPAPPAPRDDADAPRRDPVAPAVPPAGAPRPAPPVEQPTPVDPSADDRPGPDEQPPATGPPGRGEPPERDRPADPSSDPSAPPQGRGGQADPADGTDEARPAPGRPDGS